MIDDRTKAGRYCDIGELRRERIARSGSMGRELRALYRSAVQEPIPMEFIRLLNQLEAGDEN